MYHSHTFFFSQISGISLMPFKIGEIALFGKALVSALARGALTMCAMWVGRNFKNAKGWDIFFISVMSLQFSVSLSDCRCLF